MYGVVFSFKDPFDTKTCAPPAGVTHYDIDFPARDHGWSHSFGTRGRSSSPRPSTRNTTAGPAIRVAATHLRRCCRRRWAISAAPGAAIPPTPTTRHARPRSARVRDRGVGQHQSGDGQPRGGNAGVLPRTGQSQRRGAHPAAQVAARLHRRCDRGGHLLRSQRHSLPHDRRLRQSPRCPEGPDHRLLRSARSLHDRAALVGIAHAVREPRADARHPWRARGHAPRIIRESMVCAPGSKAELPIITAAAREIKTILGDWLGATLVESSDPLWHRIPRSRLCRRISGAHWPGWCPCSCPSCCSGSGQTDSPLQRVRGRDVPTEFMPGKIFGTGTMQPIDYCVALAEERIAPPANLDIATVQEQELAMAFRFHIPQYLTRRAADWQGGDTPKRWSIFHAQRAVQILG